MPRGITTKPVNSTDSSLVLFLPLYEPGLSGEHFISWDGYLHKCSVFGALWTPQGRTFATDDYIALPAGFTASYLASPFTFLSWAKRTGDSYETIFTSQTAANAAGVLFALAGNFDFRTYSPQAETEGGTCVINTWYHYVVTLNGATATLYVNGASLGATSANHSTYDVGTAVSQIGGSAVSGTYFDGTIGEVRFYNQVLTPTEVLRNYLATKWRYQ